MHSRGEDTIVAKAMPMEHCMRSMDEIPALHPVAQEGQSLLSCASFLPLSAAIIIGGAYVRALLNGAMCAFSVHYCYSANGVPARPIALGIDSAELRATEALPARSSGFSLWPPGSKVARGDGSSNARFGIAWRDLDGGAWDTPRVYEILAGGALPYIIDLDRCPTYALHALPKAQLLRAARLPGMPSRADVRRAVLSDATAVLALRDATLTAQLFRNGTARTERDVRHRGAATAASIPAAVRSLNFSEGYEHMNAKAYDSLRLEVYSAVRDRLTSRAVAQELATSVLGPSAFSASRSPVASRLAAKSQRAATLATTRAGNSSVPTNRADAGNASGLSGPGSGGDGSTAGPLRVLILADGSADPQLANLQRGMLSLGASVWLLRELPRQRAVSRAAGGRAGRGREGSRLARREAAAIASLAPGAKQPAELVIAHIGSGSSSERMAMLLRHVEKRRIVCLRTDAAPPPVWAMWAPSFCGALRVREMKLLPKWWSSA